MGRVIKLNDNNETTIDMRFVAVINKRSYRDTLNKYWIDVHMSYHGHGSTFSLLYTEQAWCDKDYTLMYNGMGQE